MGCAVYRKPLLGATLIGAYLAAKLGIEDLCTTTRDALHARLLKAAQALDYRDTLTLNHVEYLDRGVRLDRNMRQLALYPAHHLDIAIEVVLGVYATHDMHLRNVGATQLLGACLNLIHSHSPRIGVALLATERTELTVEEAYVRGLEVHISIIVDTATAHS